jgi:BirA family biotin operon repressor/biotin-[acetyl-CoA-carboxylase] ligase
VTASNGRWARLDRPPLRSEPLRRALTEGDRPAWRAVEVVTATGSTNADVAARARDGEPEGLVLTADEQLAGRGRRDRMWTAPPRSSIAVSVLLRPPVPQSRWGWVGLLAGVAVTDALIRVCGLPAELKWPNDVLLPPPPGRPPAGDQAAADPFGKVAGILAEVAGSAIVLGVGLNVSQDADELPTPSATSLLLAGAATVDRDTVLRAVLRSLADRYRRWCDAGGDPKAGDVAAPYRERCRTIGRSVQVLLPDGTALDGVAEGVNDDGCLMVRDIRDKLHLLAVGDVVHVNSSNPPHTRPAGTA